MREGVKGGCEVRVGEGVRRVRGGCEESVRRV